MPLQNSDYFLIDDNGVTKKIRADNLKAGFLSTHSGKKLLVNLSNQINSRFVYSKDVGGKVTADNWMLVDRAGTSYKIKGDKVASYMLDTIDINTAVTLDAYTGTVNTINSSNLSQHGGLAILYSTRGDQFAPVHFFDTVRGPGNALTADSSSGEYNNNFGVSSFGATTLSLHQTTSPISYLNANNFGYKGYTIQQAPGVLDVVTYTGTGSGGTQDINHNLKMKPGFIIVKNITSQTNWMIWHTDLASEEYLHMSNQGVQTNESYLSHPFARSSHTSTTFRVGRGNDDFNASGEEYVAYVFGNSSNSGVVCGSYTGDGATSQTISLPSEPRMVLVKSKGVGDWLMRDSLDSTVKILNNASNDSSSIPRIEFTSGQSNFDVQSVANTDGQEYVYMAILT